MTVIIKIIQVIFALSLLVLIHEFGHFIFARIFKIRVEKFYLFFDAGFRLFKFKPKHSDTEYGIGWLPLGGYCKIAGMIDESMDKESMKKDPQPWEFRSKPAWQRLLVLAGGVLFNVILAFIIYSAILFTWGEQYIKNSDVTTGIAVDRIAYEIGFRDGDMILDFDGNSVDNFDHLRADMVIGQAKYATVLRNGDTINIPIGEKYIPEALNTKSNMFEYGIPFVVAAIPDTSVNAGTGLRPGDKIVAIDGNNVVNFNTVKRYIANHKSDSVEVSIERKGSVVPLKLAIDGSGMFEVQLDGELSHFYKITKKKYTLLSSIPAGFDKAIATVVNYWQQLKLIVSPKTEAYKSLGSFIAIGSIFPGRWNWPAFWSITAFLSIMLAVLNILPIPALDGGHILFTLYEIITRRKPSDKFLEYAQMAGMLFLMALMILAFGNDIIRLFK
jgi:regulator of sigma E protease